MIATNFEFKHSNITQLKQNKKNVSLASLYVSLLKK